MNIPQATIEAEAKTIRHIPESYRGTVVSNLNNDSRFSEWDNESLSELKRLVNGEKMQIIPLSARRALMRPSQEVVIPTTDELNYIGPMLAAGKGNEVLYKWSWRENQGKNAPSLRDLQKEVAAINRGLDWQTTNVRQFQLSLGRDLEGYYVTLMPTKARTSAWVVNGKEVLRAGERMYFTAKGVKKFFRQATLGGVRELNKLEKLFRMNRAYAADGKEEEADIEFKMLQNLLSIEFGLAGKYGFNEFDGSRKKDFYHELVTFVGKNAHTGLFRRYIGGVYKRYNQLTDEAYIEALMRSCPEILDMPLIECIVSDNMTVIELMDESPEEARKVLDAGFKLHTPYKCLKGGNSQNSTTSAFLGGGTKQFDCWNGMFKFRGDGIVKVRKSSNYDKVVQVLGDSVYSIRLESQGIRNNWDAALNVQISNFSTFLDSMQSAYRGSTEDEEGSATNPITDGILNYIKEGCMGEATNSGDMHTATTKNAAPNAACSVQRLVDAVTYSANRCVEEGRLLTACHIQDFGCDILDRSLTKQREYAHIGEDIDDARTWGNYIDVTPRDVNQLNE